MAAQNAFQLPLRLISEKYERKPVAGKSHSKLFISLPLKYFTVLHLFVNFDLKF